MDSWTQRDTGACVISWHAPVSCPGMRVGPAVGLQLIANSS